MTLEVEPNPPGIGPSHLTITLRDAAGQPIEGGLLEIVGNMDHGGMQPRWAKARTAAGGRYEAPFVWTMDGDWMLAVSAVMPDGQIVKREFDVTVVEAATMSGHEHAPAQIPNQGAAIRIVSPQDGAIFEVGSEVRVEVETENFDLAEDGRHWHVLVDGQSPRMIMGAMTETILRHLEPGSHEISVYLSVGSHEELAEGAAVTITVADPSAQDVTVSINETGGHQAHD